MNIYLLCAPVGSHAHEVVAPVPSPSALSSSSMPRPASPGMSLHQRPHSVSVCMPTSQPLPLASNGLWLVPACLRLIPNSLWPSSYYLELPCTVWSAATSLIPTCPCFANYSFSSVLASPGDQQPAGFLSPASYSMHASLFTSSSPHLLLALHATLSHHFPTGQKTSRNLLLLFPKCVGLFTTPCSNRALLLRIKSSRNSV